MGVSWPSLTQGPGPLPAPCEYSASLSQSSASWKRVGLFCGAGAAFGNRDRHGDGEGGGKSGQQSAIGEGMTRGIRTDKPVAKSEDRVICAARQDQLNW